MIIFYKFVKQKRRVYIMDIKVNPDINVMKIN